MLICYRILSRSLSAVITFHDVENKATSGGSAPVRLKFVGIAVANHTSPIDVMVLSTDNVYALIGQRHSGFLGYFQRALSRAAAHIWFERSEAKDRSLVTETFVFPSSGFNDFIRPPPQLRQRINADRALSGCANM